MKNILMIGSVMMVGYAGLAVLSAQEPNPQILDAFKKWDAQIQKGALAASTLAASGGVILVGAKRVTGAPFSAVAINESIQPLVDGNRIVHKYQEKLYRDSQGRERRESEGASFTVLGQLMATGDVVIFDPAENASYSFNLQGLTATKKLALD